MKKLLALMLSLVMVLCLFAGCGGEEEEEYTDDEEMYEEVEEDMGDEEEYAEEAEGFDISQVQGISWVYASLNGVDYMELCEQNNLDPATAGATWEIISDSEITLTPGNGEAGTYPITITENGFIITDDAGESPVVYSAEDNTLSVDLLTPDGNVTSIVLVPQE